MDNRHPDSTPKSVFLHLLMIGMLYISIIAVLVLAFQYSNVLFEDALSYQYEVQRYYEMIRWGSSVLLISYPVFVYVTWLISKDIYAKPELRNRRERRWLVHFTLFLTAITIIVDLMVLVYNFYGGELTTRFAIKVFSVLIVAAITLGYYRWELHRDYSTTKLPKQMAIGVGAVLLALLVTGFFVAGSPNDQRNVRFDSQRVSDLQSIQSHVFYYWEAEKTLPTDMKQLQEGVGTDMPTDPETSEPYTYTVLTSDTFELCATFTTENLDTTGGVSYNRAPLISTMDDPSLYDGAYWTHTAEYTCFERRVKPSVPDDTIDDAVQ